MSAAFLEISLAFFRELNSNYPGMRGAYAHLQSAILSKNYSEM